MKTLEQLAKEAGFKTYTYKSGAVEYSSADMNSDGMNLEDLARFRALCMEEAAQIADELDCPRGELNGLNAYEAYEEAMTQCAEAIRASIKEG